jgi:hypothetical protein
VKDPKLVKDSEFSKLNFDDGPFHDKLDVSNPFLQGYGRLRDGTYVYCELAR